MRIDCMHLNICLDSCHQIPDAVSAHAQGSWIVRVRWGLQCWAQQLGRKIGRMQLQYNPFQMLRRRKAVLAVTQMRFAFNHDLLNPFFIRLYGFEAHLRVRAKHPRAYDLEGQRDYSAKGFKVRELARLRIFAVCNFRLTDGGG